MTKYRSARHGAVGIATATVTAMLIALTGCAADAGGEADAAGVSATPVEGGTLTYLINQATTTLDPAVSPASATALMARNIFDSLVVQSAPGVFEPWLATEWTISPDGTVYTFQLEDGVRFHDGTALTADAVKATLDHIIDPASKSQNTTRVSAYEGSTVIDDLTIEVTLSQPFRPFLDALSSTALGIQSPTSLSLPAEDYEPVGTGPFSYVSWDQQKTLVLERNPDYDWAPASAAHEGPAYLDELRFDLVTEDATRFGALISGEAQAIADVPAADFETLTATAGFQALTASAPGIPYSLYFNATGGLTADLRVRRALQAAIDVPTIVESVYFGTSEPATNVLGPATTAYDASAAAFLQGYDPDRAVQLLEEAGWTETNADGYRTKDGHELELVWPAVAGTDRADRSSIAQAVQDQAKQVGIRISRPSIDVAAALSLLSSGDYDLWDGSNERADPDILRDFFGSDRTFEAGGANISRVSSRELDGWLNEGLTTGNQDVAEEAYAHVQQDVLQNAYVLPIYVGQYTLGVTDSLHGVTFYATAQPLLYDAWLSE